MQAVFEHLSESLHRELDFRQEAANIERMRGGDRGLLAPAACPVVFADFSTSRLLVMQDIGGGPDRDGARGAARARRRPASCSSPSTSRSWSTASSTPTRTPGT